jgi:hypothetical protein
MTKLDEKAVAGGRGFGELSKTDLEFLKSYDPKADRQIYGKKGVGMFATSDKPRVVRGDE